MALDFDKMGGLIPAIIQDALTKNVLMLGFMNQEAYNKTLETNKVTFFIQSEIPELTELTFYYMNLVTLSRLTRNPTVKEELKQKKEFGGSIPMGFLTYPVSQAADITAFNATIIPVGICVILTADSVLLTC